MNYIVYSLYKKYETVPYRSGIIEVGSSLLPSKPDTIIQLIAVTDSLQQAKEIKSSINICDKYVRKKIICNSNGIVYDSASDACRQLGLKRSAMSLHLNNPVKYPNVHGYTFRRTE